MLSRNEVEASRNIMASLLRGAPPRQNKKAKSYLLDLGLDVLDVLDLDGNGRPMGYDCSKSDLKNRFKI